MVTLMRILVAAALILGASRGVSVAQDALILDNKFVSASRDPGQAIGPAPPELLFPLAGGGRYAVFYGHVLDRRTGVLAPLPLDSTVLAVDPARPRAFLKRNCDVALDLCNVVTYDLVSRREVWLTTAAASDPSGWLSTPTAKYAIDADVLFVDRSSPGPPYPLGPLSIQAVNASTGVTVGPLLAVRRASWDVLPDATRLFVASGFVLSTPTGIDVIDTATEQVVASDANRAYALDWEPISDALLVNGGGLTVYDRDLRLVGYSSLGGQCGVHVRVSAHTGRIYVLDGGGDSTTGLTPHRFQVYSPASGQWLNVDIGRTAGLSPRTCTTLTLLTAPGPPRNLRATVSGRDVALRWQNLGAASHFVLDVGFAPGRTDASVFLGPDSHATIANVPAGTYYLRLRGGSEFGGGRASSEIQLVVP